MTLPMTRPWKHPKTGMYWLRKRVPTRLRAAIGKTEEKCSLGTRDPAEARRLLPIKLAEVHARWSNLQAGPRPLSEREAHELCRPIHDQWLQKHQANPSEQTFWPIEIGNSLWVEPSLDPTDLMSVFSVRPNEHQFQRLKQWCFDTAEQFLKAHGLKVDDADRRKLAMAVSAAMQRASIELDQMSRGELGLGWLPQLDRQPITLPRVLYDDLVAGWSAEASPTQKTLYEWKRVVKQLQTFVGEDDAGRLKTEDVIAWKADLVSKGLRPKTIRDAKLAPVRAILQWAVDNKRLTTNAAARVSIDVKPKAMELRRGYSETEAALVLRAADQQDSSVLRWMPRLCACSGARISEVCQLRAEDVLEIDDIWCMRIAPEAGPLKTLNSERVIPVHPALVDQGFLDFVREVGRGPLFPRLKPDKFGSRGGNGTKILGRWVRSLGVTDPRISPNHSWRHRFKTLSRRYGLATDLVDAIIGHRRRTVADGYGEFPIAALKREIMKIPALYLASELASKDQGERLKSTTSPH